MGVSTAAMVRDGESKLSGGYRWTWWLATTALLALPAMLVRYPPVLDLAQLVSQVRLLPAAVGGTGDLVVQWLSPDKIGYLPVAAGWWIGGAVWGPRLGLALAVLLSIAAVFLLARRVGAPPEHAALASIFVLARPLHVGLLNFIVGTLPFFLWLDELRRPPGESQVARPAWRAFLFGWALYFSHALLLAGAAGLTVAMTVGRRSAWRSSLARLAGLAPAVAACAIWYGGFVAAEWRSHPHWILDPLQRLIAPRAWRLYLLGSVQGSAEPLILAALVLWAGLCAFGARGRGWPEAAASLSKFAALMLGVAWLAPEGLGDTVFFAQRWAPLAASVALLALPRAPVRRRLAALFAGALVVGWSAVLCAAWRGFDHQEMRGFESALAAVPERAHLLTLDFLRLSPRFFALPYFQMGGYAEIERDAVLASSFADLPTSPVVHRILPRPVPWTRRLENYPLGLKASDLAYFDAVLLHADPETRDRFLERFPGLSVSAGQAFWWLLAVETPRKAPSAMPRQGAG